MESAGGGPREAVIRPLTAEEEALKRSTDCVYFLASPLTCKKGAECEYRHSEGARMNPRDCYFWLNGSCLNPKCLFRHPPIDGLFGTPGTTSVQAPSSHTAPTPQTSIAPPYNPSNKSVPCYYFQKGLCLKGDRCSFMHGPPPAGTPTPHQVPKVSASSSEPQQTPMVLKQCTSQKKISKASDEKPVGVPISTIRPVAKAIPRHGIDLVHERGPSPYPPESDIPRSQITSFPVNSDQDGDVPRNHYNQPLDELSLNDKDADEFLEDRDADEFLGESSPGFDVLVDDDVEDSGYLHNEDEFGREPGRVGRNLYPVNEFYCHLSEYETVAGFENGPEGYGRNNELVRHDRYSRESHSLSESRRALQRRESPEEMDGSDLRHRLLKQRRLNGSRRNVDPDRHGGPCRRDDRYNNDDNEEDRYHIRRPHRDQHEHHQHWESSISTRLQGRITLPSRPSPDLPLDPWYERGRDRGRFRGRLSPPRPVNYQGRMHHDRVNRKSHEDPIPGARNFRGQQQPIRRENAGPLDFAGPKSLAELKGGSRASNNPQERRSRREDGYQGSDRSASFEGPKPPGDILKRKREATPDDNHGAEITEVASDPWFVCIAEVEKGYNNQRVGSKWELQVPSAEEEEGLIAKGGELDQASDKDQELEGDDIKTEGHDGDEEMESVPDDDDDDDDDDFARKVGVMFS